MSALLLDGRRIALDKDGHLCHLQDWSPEVAAALAQADGLRLSEAHMEIISEVRAFYGDYQLAPNMRALVRYVKERLGAEKGNSLYINQLFQGSPARQIARLGGLPKPSGCL